MVEADLQIHCGVDYRDRWCGTPRLTLRRIKVLITHLPPESALATLERDGQPYWTVEAHLIDDLRMVQVHSKKHPAKPHPGRPTGKGKRLDPKAIASGQRRRAERRRAIEAGDIT